MRGTPGWSIAGSVALLGAAGAALATPGTGVSASVLAAGVMADPLEVNRAGIRFETSKPVQLVTQRVELEAEGHTGWPATRTWCSPRSRRAP